MPRPELSTLRYPNLWQGCVGAWCPSQSGATGYRLFDDSGNNNHGVLTNMDPGTDWVPSSNKLALDFDGSNDIAVINPISSASSEGITACCFVKAGSDIGTDAQIFSQYNTTNNQRAWQIGVRSSGTALHVIISRDGQSYDIKQYESVNTIFDGNWVHVAFVFKPNSLSLFSNGVELSVTKIVDVAFNKIENLGAKIGIGGRQAGSSYTAYSKAFIDDARIYNRALAPYEIRQLASSRGAAYERSRGRKKAYIPGYRITATSRIQTGSARTIDGTDTESLSRGLVGAWCPSLGASGYRLLDRSGNNNHGTLTNMDPGTDWVPSNGKLALDFDGSNDYVTSDGPNIENKTFVSLCSWIFRPASGTLQTFGYGTTSQKRVSLLWFSDNRVYCQVEPGSTTSYPNALVNVTGWHHVCMVFNGSLAASNRIGLYIDGVFTPLTSGGSDPGTVTQNNIGPFEIGREFANSRYSTGMYDDVRVYNRVLTPSEIRLLYTGGRGVGLLPEAKPKRARIVAWDNRDKISVPARVLTNTDSLKRGLVGHWSPSLSGPQGNRLMDLSGQNNHGTLQNMDYQTDYVPSAEKGGRMALDFDGFTNSVNTSLLMKSIPFDVTVSCWAYPYRSATTVERGFLWGGADASTPTFDFQVYTDNNIYVGWLKSGNDRRIVISKTNAGWVQNQWQNFTFVSSTRFGSILYRNGVQVGSNTNANFVAGFTTQTLEIGSNTAVSGFNMFFGQIDDVRLYNRALTTSEIRLLAQFRMPERATPQRTRTVFYSSGLVSYLRRRTYNSILGSGVLS